MKHNNRFTMILLAMLCLSLVAIPAMAVETGTEPLDEAAFTQAYADLMAEKEPSGTYTISEEEPLLVTAEMDGGNLGVQIGLESAYAAYTSTGALEDVLDYYSDAALSVLQGSEDNILSRTNVMPVVKPQEYMDMLLENNVNDAVYDEFIDGLFVLYVLDTPSAIRPIHESELEEAGIARDELLALSLQNLMNMLPSPHFDSYEGITTISVDGMYESSLLLFDFNDVTSFDVDGDVIVGVPSRDMLFVAGSNDATAIEVLNGFVQMMYESTTYPVASQLLKWDGSAFAWYTP